MIPGCFLPRVESPGAESAKNKHLGLPVCNSLSSDQKLKPWARKLTNKKPRKYNGMMGGPDVQTEKKHETTWLFDCKYQPG